jgi:NAD/NADP transhydrogenase beta subunit
VVDMKDTIIKSVETQEKSQSQNLFKGIFMKFVDAFHKFGLWILIAIALGIYIGITVARGYYVTKMNECIKIGGFLHQEKVYTVTPR